MFTAERGVGTHLEGTSEKAGVGTVGRLGGWVGGRQWLG